MKKMVAVASPDAYVQGLDGWRLELVTTLRAAVRASKALSEAVKWGHLVYSTENPVLLIRAEDERVLFGFWRGQRLQDIEPRLRPGGKFEMATLELREGMNIPAARARRLVKAALELDATLGDPRLASPKVRAKKAAALKKRSR
ncbi:hypothetical protein GAU_2211 [Gemmatimonas aurantiaca T-27]|uniref:YdhG-like domain-containing protein n=2 Tax=Gemmatimonas aurantiaca TaxID=173480 RepID=C1A9S6_GEMAT|nr:hypothetical protein GAU_2211 [Gemmatimonas aurantiaca T-27]